MEFSKAPIWVQLLGLPINGKPPQMGMIIREKLGEVVEAGLYKMANITTIIKVRIKIIVEKPIKLGLYRGSIANGVNLIDFFYEKLPMFYFKYGIIGHNEKHCQNFIVARP